MNTRAERDVTIALAIDDELVGVLELCRVAVGGRERHQHLVARLHRAPCDIDVGDDLSRHGHRTVDA